MLNGIFEFLYLFFTALEQLLISHQSPVFDYGRAEEENGRRSKAKRERQQQHTATVDDGTALDAGRVMEWRSKGRRDEEIVEEFDGVGRVGWSRFIY
jgi:hypothetical protein